MTKYQIFVVFTKIFINFTSQKLRKRDEQHLYTIEIETNKMNLKKNEYSQKSKQAEIDRTSEIITDHRITTNGTKRFPLKKDNASGSFR